LPKQTLIILDDLMMECSKNSVIGKLFSVIARKRQISVILIVQNVYPQGSQFRNIRLNASAFALFKFNAGFDVNHRLLRDLGLRSKISRQQMDDLYSGKFKFLFIELHPERWSDYGTLRSNIFDQYPTIYYGSTYFAISRGEFESNYRTKYSKNGRLKAYKLDTKILSSDYDS